MSDEAPAEKKGNAEMPTEVIKTLPDPAAEYIAGVRAALSDLPASEVAEILDDVQSHLADLATELGADAGTTAFTDRLGTPAAYAAELRAAAGYPPAPLVAPKIQPPGPVAAAFAVAGLVIATGCAALLVAARDMALPLVAVVVATIGLLLIMRDGPRLPSVAALPVVRDLRAALPAAGQPARGVTGFVASLQPAWWVVRAMIAALLLERVILGGGSWFVVVLVGIAGVLVSIWLGRQSRLDRRWLWLVVPLNGLAVGLVLAAAFAGGSTTSPSYSSGPPSPTSYPRQGLWQDDREIRDIRPVDGSGTPLSGVYLFDQDGRPITTDPGCAAREAHRSSSAVPVMPYPQGVSEYGRNGVCEIIPPAPLVAAIPKATVSPQPPSSVPPSPVAATPAPPAPSAPPTTR